MSCLRRLPPRAAPALGRPREMLCMVLPWAPQAAPSGCPHTYVALTGAPAGCPAGRARRLRPCSSFANLGHLETSTPAAINVLRWVKCVAMRARLLFVVPLCSGAGVLGRISARCLDGYPAGGGAPFSPLPRGSAPFLGIRPKQPIAPDCKPTLSNSSWRLHGDRARFEALVRLQRYSDRPQAPSDAK